MNMAPFHAAYIALWLILAGYWAYGAWGNKRTAYRTSPFWRILAIVVFAVLVAAFNWLPDSFHQRICRYGPAAEWSGVAMCAVGVAFAIWARRTLGKNWSGNPTIKEGHELVTTGPYRLVRHPIYTGLILVIVGTLIGTGKVSDLLILAFLCIAGLVKIRIEESLMTRQFPEAYPAYRRRTKALIPFIF